MLNWLKNLLRRFGLFDRRRYPRNHEFDAMFCEVREKERKGWLN